MNIFLADEQDEPLSTDTLCTLAEMTLEAEGLESETELTLMLVTDEVIASYNERFMGREGPTDVLAFPLETLVPGDKPHRPYDGPPVNLGDVIIAPAYVRANAQRTGADPDAELALMVVHGVLHLLGYEHPTDEAAEAMEDRERVILGGMGITRP